MHCRIAAETATEFRSKLGFNQHDIIMNKDQLALTRIIKMFASEKILLQHYVLNYRVDLYFPEHKLVIERDCNWTRTHNHLVHKRTLNHLAKLAK